MGTRADFEQEVFPAVFVDALREAVDSKMTEAQVMSVLKLAMGVWVLMDRFEEQDLLNRSAGIMAAAKRGG